ncbi:MAG TPA: LiaF domain-containing protein [Mucilaginibacter sp.]|nr:LiaF domain-containing protein [Mucilaginibacter sp.]
MNTHATLSFANADDYINTTAVFSSVKKTILSKDFRGGAISNLFGATEIDFTHADLCGVAVLDITQGFGEVKLIVPADWWVESDATQILATLEDNRVHKEESFNSNKILILRGTSVFGVVQVSNSK